MSAGPDLQLRDPSDLDALLERAARETVVLFKHSTACPISAHAYGELVRFVRARANGAPLVALVRVIEERAVSRAIEQRLGVRHESPQAIVLRGGVPAATLSHGEITADALREASGGATPSSGTGR